MCLEKEKLMISHDSAGWVGGSSHAVTGAHGSGCMDLPRQAWLQVSWLRSQVWQEVLAVGWASLVLIHVASRPPAGYTGFLACCLGAKLESLSEHFSQGSHSTTFTKFYWLKQVRGSPVCRQGELGVPSWWKDCPSLLANGPANRAERQV